jgi:hypothetical protein
MSRSRLGCFGLILGGMLGLLVAVIVLLLVSAGADSPILAEPVMPPTDVSLFLSERTLSRIATEELQEPVWVDFEPGGQLELTTPVEIGGFKPVVRLGLTLESLGPEVVSQLHWLKLGFLKISANWLPPELVELGALLGETITEQIPPEFTLIGLATTADGLNFHLNWIY